MCWLQQLVISERPFNILCMLPHVGVCMNRPSCNWRNQFHLLEFANRDRPILSLPHRQFNYSKQKKHLIPIGTAQQDLRLDWQVAHPSLSGFWSPMSIVDTSTLSYPCMPAPEQCLCKDTGEIVASNHSELNRFTIALVLKILPP